jgi:transcriptional regulator with XRE-family HTH domain
MKRLTQSSLAAQLGLSQSRVSELSSLGMPTSNIDAARAWHASNIRLRTPPAPQHPPPEWCEGFDQGTVRTYLALREFVARHGVTRFGPALIPVAGVMTDAAWEDPRMKHLERAIEDAWEAIEADFDALTAAPTP